MRSPLLILMVPLCLAFTSCDKSPAEECDALGKSLGEMAAKASGRVVKSAKKTAKEIQSGTPSDTSTWDPEVQALPPGMRAIHQK